MGVRYRSSEVGPAVSSLIEISSTSCVSTAENPSQAPRVQTFPPLRSALSRGTSRAHANRPGCSRWIFVTRPLDSRAGYAILLREGAIGSRSTSHDARTTRWPASRSQRAQRAVWRRLAERLGPPTHRALRRDHPEPSRRSSRWIARERRWMAERLGFEPTTTL